MAMELVLQRAPITMCDYATQKQVISEIESHLSACLHYVFDTGSGSIMERARFSGKKGSFEPSE